MKKSIRTIVTVGCIMICACLFGSIQASAAEPTTESIIDVTQVIDFTVDNGSLQLYFNDGTGYYWEKGIDIVSGVILNEYIQYDDNYIDMRTVVDYSTTEYAACNYTLRMDRATTWKDNGTINR